MSGLADPVVVRLANEGVPLSAICRATGRCFEEVELLVREGIDAGQLLEMPASDWPPGSPRVGRAPTAAPLKGGRPVDITTALMSVYRLAPTEARLLAALVKRTEMAKAALYAAVWDASADDAPAVKIVDVMVCKLRKKLAPHGIEISTLWGRGFRLPAEARETVLLAVRAHERELAGGAA